MKKSIFSCDLCGQEKPQTGVKVIELTRQERVLPQVPSEFSTITDVKITMVGVYTGTFHICSSCEIPVRNFCKIVAENSSRNISLDGFKRA